VSYGNASGFYYYISKLLINKFQEKNFLALIIFQFICVKIFFRDKILKFSY